MALSGANRADAGYLPGAYIQLYPWQIATSLLTSAYYPLAPLPHLHHDIPRDIHMSSLTAPSALFDPSLSVKVVEVARKYDEPEVCDPILNLELRAVLFPRRGLRSSRPFVTENKLTQTGHEDRSDPRIHHPWRA